MLLRRRRAIADEPENDVLVEPGASMARGPALILGSILAFYGLLGLLTNANFPNFSDSFPDATQNGNSWLGLEVNGWTNFFIMTAGILLLIGAAQHHVAKGMSLLVGLALIACAIIAIIDGEDVLGLAAANTWTKVGFAVAGALCVLNALMPRRMHRRPVDGMTTTTAATTTGGAVAADRPRTGRRFGRPADRTVADRDADGVTDDAEQSRR
jgi:hypothetical protein